VQLDAVRRDATLAVDDIEEPDTDKGDGLVRLQAGVDIRVIRDYLGHASIATTAG
jgi:hypothetical protein